MMRLRSETRLCLFLIVICGGATSAQAQSAAQAVDELNRQAMEAYQALDINRAGSILEQVEREREVDVAEVFQVCQRVEPVGPPGMPGNEDEVAGLRARGAPHQIMLGASGLAVLIGRRRLAAHQARMHAESRSVNRQDRPARLEPVGPGLDFRRLGLVPRPQVLDPALDLPERDCAQSQVPFRRRAEPRAFEPRETQ